MSWFTKPSQLAGCIGLPCTRAGCVGSALAAPVWVFGAAFVPEAWLFQMGLGHHLQQ